MHRNTEQAHGRKGRKRWLNLKISDVGSRLSDMASQERYVVLTDKFGTAPKIRVVNSRRKITNNQNLGDENALYEGRAKILRYVDDLLFLRRPEFAESNLPAVKPSYKSLVEVMPISSSASKKERGSPVSDFVPAANRLGITLGVPIDSVKAGRVVDRLADDMDDLFASKDEALSYLQDEDFGSGGVRAIDLIMQGRLVSVLARLDELRFGVRG